MGRGTRFQSVSGVAEGDVEWHHWHVGLCFMTFNRHVMWFAAALWPLLVNVARLLMRCETKTKTQTTSYWKLPASSKIATSAAHHVSVCLCADDDDDDDDFADTTVAPCCSPKQRLQLALPCSVVEVMKTHK